MGADERGPRKFRRWPPRVRRYRSPPVHDGERERNLPPGEGGDPDPRDGTPGNR